MPERRYAVMRVMRDGIPHDLSFWDSLEDALSERDLQRRDSFALSVHFGVYDREDPERGYLNHDDVYDEATR